jgi:hypothetical protein
MPKDNTFNILNESLNVQQNLAYKFSEGSEDLYNLLLLLWNKGIYTLGCCSGHDNNKAYFSFMLTNFEANFLASCIIEIVNKYSDLGIKCYILGPHPETKFLDFSFIFPKKHIKFIIKKLINHIYNMDFTKEVQSELTCAYQILNSGEVNYFSIESSGTDNKTVTLVNKDYESHKHNFMFKSYEEILEEIKAKTK